jgi:hypothetical protein
VCNVTATDSYESSNPRYANVTVGWVGNITGQVLYAPYKSTVQQPLQGARLNLTLYGDLDATTDQYGHFNLTGINSTISPYWSTLPDLPEYGLKVFKEGMTQQFEKTGVPFLGEVHLNFVLYQIPQEDCNMEQCTLAGTNTCSMLCCPAEVNEICDGAPLGSVAAFTDYGPPVVDMEIVCCKGDAKPKTLLPESKVNVPGENVVKTTRIVYYRGKPIRMVITTWG